MLHLLWTYYSAPEPSIVISLSACLTVCPRAYLWNRWTDLHKILCADHVWPWFGPVWAALRYVMYFRFMDDVMFGCSGPCGDAWKAEPLAYYY